jgi:uncharacterized cupin superfamily protein
VVGVTLSPPAGVSPAVPVIHESELDWSETDEGDARFRRKRLGGAAGGDDLGASLYELLAGERSWPYHYHTGNEEAIYVLAGEGLLVLDGDEHRIEAGHYAAFPADESGGHRVVNDSTGPLRYLAVSTMNDPDVTVYPGMDKVGVFAGSPPGGSGERTVHGYFDPDDAVDYWE